MTLTFSGPVTDAQSAMNGGMPSLADGRYSLTITSRDVVNHQNQLLDGDGNGVPGGDYISPVDTPGGGPASCTYTEFLATPTATGSWISSTWGSSAAHFNSSAGDPLYQADLDADNSGTIDQADLGQFRSRMNSDILAVVPPLNFYVNPATGNDANDGRTPSTAWKTWDRLVEAVADGTITGGAWLTADDARPILPPSRPMRTRKLGTPRICSAIGRSPVRHIYIDTSEAHSKSRRRSLCRRGAKSNRRRIPSPTWKSISPFPPLKSWAQPGRHGIPRRLGNDQQDRLSVHGPV